MDDEAPLALEERRWQRIVELHTSVFEKAAAYDSAILAGGYIAFFALWAVVSDKLPAIVVLASVFLMGVSLISYLGFTITTMLMRQSAHAALQVIIAEAADPSDFETRWNAQVMRNNRRSGKIMALWRWSFPISAISGIGGGTLISAASLCELVRRLA